MCRVSGTGKGVLPVPLTRHNFSRDHPGVLRFASTPGYDPTAATRRTAESLLAPTATETRMNAVSFLEVGEVPRSGTKRDEGSRGSCENVSPRHRISGSFAVLRPASAGLRRLWMTRKTPSRSAGLRRG
jgi:hypothetical protein